MCIRNSISPNQNLLCQETFSDAIIEENEDFENRDWWQAEVNSWTLNDNEIYDRSLILESVNFVPDWAFEVKYEALKWEDPTNDNLMMCQSCFLKNNQNTVAHIWREEGLVEPFDFKDIYEQEDLWCCYCDSNLFKFIPTDI